MRKLIFGVLVIFFVIAVLFYCQPKEEMRVRIIPNGDEAQDLKVKEQAKNLVVCYLKELYDENFDRFSENISATYDSLRQLLTETLDIPCKVDFGKHTFYNKTYNDNAILNEQTLTLYVVLGKGEGSNWWGTIYPEFLQISGSEEVQYESLIARWFQKRKGE